MDPDIKLSFRDKIIKEHRLSIGNFTVKWQLLSMDNRRGSHISILWNRLVF